MSRSKSDAVPAGSTPLASAGGDPALVVTYGESNSVVVDVATIPFSDPATYINDVTEAVVSRVLSARGAVPATAIGELVANLIHAGFAAPVISVLDTGFTVRIADSGPGIGSTALAVEPGYTTASPEDRLSIRGAGAGLPIAAAALRSLGGRLDLTANVSGGTVATASVPRANSMAGALPQQQDARTADSSLQRAEPTDPQPISGEELTSSPQYSSGGHLTGSAGRGTPLSARQREVLALIADAHEAGPSTVSDTLGIPLSTAHRDLLLLEERGLVAGLGGGKRQVTAMGLEVLRVY